MAQGGSRGDFAVDEMDRRAEHSPASDCGPAFQDDAGQQRDFDVEAHGDVEVGAAGSHIVTPWRIQ